eukprot:TRINITY_DN66396_c6_g3_i1.p1 TRINITY_DN66396_c6_g3~~TRINITY_DN66396_c6_g3_i1.p1  ORF type:complete len:359 (+),score=213.02 TRINITY_DN66396_c6_g3_i1:381-1457(+)
MVKKTMKAALVTEFGPPDKVTVVSDRPVGRHEDRVLVKIHYSAVNPVDYKILQGNLEGIIGSLPYPLGLDASGVVEDIGSKVDVAKYGGLLNQRVFIYQDWKEGGMFAEYAWVRPELVVPMPKNMSFAEAAAVPLVGVTSYQALAWAKPKKGAKVLVLGGSGGTGTFALQWLANVVEVGELACTCGEANVELCKELGATRVINYRKEKWWEVLKGEDYDVIYDTVGGYESWANSKLVFGKKKGRYVTIAGDEQGKANAGRMIRTVAGVVNRKFWSLSTGPCYQYFAASPNFDHLDAIRAAIEAGKIKARIDSTFSLDDVGKALARSASHRARGKILVKIIDDDDGGKNNNSEENKEAE